VSTLRLRDSDLAWREVGDEVVVLDLRASVYATVNEAGRALWLLLADGASEEELIQLLERAYGLDRAQARRDAEAFVSTLKARELLA
jgi:hypothetical protein